MKESVNDYTGIKQFLIDDEVKPAAFKETISVADGVECDVYAFVDDETRDLGIIRISEGKQTPLQKVLMGDKTIEGYIAGKGKLLIKKASGEEVVHHVGLLPFETMCVSVEIGDTMQWQAAEDSHLIAYEICYPPYEDDRYENVE